jgi:hypothetical protein
MGLFSSRSSTSSTNYTDASVDYEPIANQNGLVATDGATVTITDGGAIEAGRAMVEEGNDTVRAIAAMQNDTSIRLGESIINLADNEGARATRIIEGSIRQQGTFLDRVLDMTARTQGDAQNVLNTAMNAAAAANTPADERQQRNVLIGLGLVAAVMVAVAYFGKR